MDSQIAVAQIPCPGRDSGRRANGRTRGDLLPCEHTGCTALHTTPRMPLRTAPSARFRPQAQGRTSEALARERLHPAAFPLSGQHASYLPFMACQHDLCLVHSICRGASRVNMRSSTPRQGGRTSSSARRPCGFPYGSVNPCSGALSSITPPGSPAVPTVRAERDFQSDRAGQIT